MQFHRGQPGSGTVLHQALFQHGQEPGGYIPVDQQGFLGVAHAGTAGFGVLHNAEGHVQVGCRIHIDVADAGAGLNAGDGGILHTGADQTGTAPGDQQIHQAVRRHQFVGAGVAGILN